MIEISTLRKIGTQRLIVMLKTAVREERRSLIDVLATLGEFDRRRAYAEEGFSSTYAYTTKELKYSEQAAYMRIRAARIARRYHTCLSYIKEGSLSLTAMSLLSPALDDSNYEELFERAKGKTRLQIEQILAELGPRPAPRDVIRIDGVWTPPGSEKAKPNGSTSTPVPETAPFRIRIAFSANEEMVRDIERAKQMLFHKYPAGGLSDIFADSLDVLLNRADPDRRMKLKRPASKRPQTARPKSRRVPQWVKDEVWKRDAGRCRYVAKTGHRCLEQKGLEYDHIIPHGLGGRSDTPANIRLLCGTHNQLAGETYFDGGRHNA